MDRKIADTLLKNRTKQHTDGWDTPTKVWVHMGLHLPHGEGGFGVTFNDVTKDTTFYTTTSRFVTCLGAFSQERRGGPRMIFRARPHGHRFLFVPGRKHQAKIQSVKYWYKKRNHVPP